MLLSVYATIYFIDIVFPGNNASASTHTQTKINDNGIQMTMENKNGGGIKKQKRRLIISTNPTWHVRRRFVVQEVITTVDAICLEIVADL